MDQRKSFVTFKDGHTEEILYFERCSNTVLFTVRSGVYVYRDVLRYTPGVSGVFLSTNFLKVTAKSELSIALECEEEFNIESITLDERVEVSYSLDIKGKGSIMGKVLVAPNAEFNEIRNAILDDLRGTNAEKIDCNDSYIPNRKPIFEKDELVKKEEMRALLHG